MPFFISVSVASTPAQAHGRWYDPLNPPEELTAAVGLQPVVVWAAILFGLWVIASQIARPRRWLCGVSWLSFGAAFLIFSQSQIDGSSHFLAAANALFSVSVLLTVSTLLWAAFSAWKHRP